MKILNTEERREKALKLIERILSSPQFSLYTEKQGEHATAHPEHIATNLDVAVMDALRNDDYSFEFYSKSENACGGNRIIYTLRHYTDNAYYYVVVYRKWDQVCRWSKVQNFLKRFTSKSRFFRKVQIDIESQYVCHLYYTPTDYYEFYLSEKWVKPGVNDTNTPFMQAVRSSSINAERKEYEQRKRLFEYHSYLGRTR